MYHFEKQKLQSAYLCVRECTVHKTDMDNLVMARDFKTWSYTVWMSHRQLSPIASSNENRTVFPWAIRSKARFPIHLKPVKVSYDKTRSVLSIAIYNLADISGVGVTVRKQKSALSSVLTVNLHDKFLFKSLQEQCRSFFRNYWFTVS